MEISGLLEKMKTLQSENTNLNLTLSGINEKHGAFVENLRCERDALEV